VTEAIPSKAPEPKLRWQEAKIAAIMPDTPRVKSFLLAPSEPFPFRAGQHVDVRLTAPDGYQAERSYSIASAPEDGGLVVTVERLEDGEVSGYLTDELREGDEFELRGPIGGYFVWEAALGGPLLLVAGGSGVVPFRSMLRHHEASGSDVPARLLYSARSLDDVIYREEFEAWRARDEIGVRVALTRAWPDDWDGYRRRIDDAMLEEVAWRPDERPLVFVCGPTAFVETAAESLVRIGHAPDRIRTERFGGTG
jgi:ferredoxin-NADP reductase